MTQVPNKHSGNAAQFAAEEDRSLLHERITTFRGFRTAAGLWELEAELIDKKATAWPSSEKGLLPAETPLHHMLIKLALDESMSVVAAEVRMAATPYAECQGAVPRLQCLIGARVASGWRKSVDAALGGTAGCTHLRELLVNMGTAAFQTVAGEQHRRAADQASDLLSADSSKYPPQLDKCIAWDVDGAVVLRHYPQFYRKRPA